MMFLDNIKRKRKVFRSNWLSIMKVGVFCDMEGISFTAVGNLPRFSYIWGYFVVLVHPGEAGKNL